MKRILVVEDEEPQQLLYRHALAGLYEVVIVSSAEEALRVLDGTYALLIADNNLGKGMSGLTLAGHVHSRFPHLSIIIATGDTTVAHPEFVTVLFKPFTIARLRYYLERLTPT